MYKETLKSIILSRQRAIPKIPLKPRTISFGDEANYVLVGLRRAGKSYMTYQDIQSRIARGKSTADDILHVNFEDERLMGMRAFDLNQLLEAYHELYGSEMRPVIYLDEIQNVEGWEKFARRLADEGYRVMITGSNARMLSRDMASTLGGRYVPREIHPFSFREYLEYEGICLSDNWLYDESVRADVVRMFNEYLRHGGIAESFRQNDKEEYLNALYQKILVGDIVERNKIRNSRIFRLLVRKLAGSVMQPSSLSRLQHIIKSTGDAISLTVLKDYLDYMREAYLTIEISNMASPITERETMKKRYLVDNGILNLFVNGGEATLLENLVGINLVNTVEMADGEPAVFFYNKGAAEVDFCVPSQRLAIQVSTSIGEPTTLEREQNALLRFVKAFPDYRPLIITLNERQTICSNKITIQVIPAWEWLLTK